MAIIVKNNLNEKIKKFNTPNSDNIDSLFRGIAGVEKITECLETLGWRKKIDETLKIRHSIAHTGSTSVTLSISSNFSRMQIFMQAATKIEEAVKNTLKNDRWIIR